MKKSFWLSYKTFQKNSCEENLYFHNGTGYNKQMTDIGTDELAHLDMKNQKEERSAFYGNLLKSGK